MIYSAHCTPASCGNRLLPAADIDPDSIYQDVGVSGTAATSNRKGWNALASKWGPETTLP